METTSRRIQFESVGIAKIIADNRLSVPLNQRSYKWESEHVHDLFQDISANVGRSEYFLGTIVLTGGNGRPEIADGQQRLATVTIIIAAVRNYFMEIDQEERAREVERRFLQSLDLKTQEIVPYLQLNVSDNGYFMDKILRHSHDANLQPSRDSHKRIDEASRLADEHVRNLVRPVGMSEGIKRIVELVEYLEKSAIVILVRVPEHLNAFSMFETLNDRGLDLSQADLLKNMLFGKAKESIDEANHQWSHMEGTIDSLGNDANLVTYIRHLWITLHGPTKEKDLYGGIEKTIQSRSDALGFLTILSSNAKDYVAIFSPSDQKWDAYGRRTKGHIETICTHLRVSQIRPLLFAIAGKFDVAEAKKAIKMCVCWSVRYIFVGGRGGFLDSRYSEVAYKIGKEKIRTADDLYAAMRHHLPQDEEFRAAFAKDTILRAYWARYFLRSLEQKATRQEHPEFVPNEDETSITLEHIIPRNPGENWNAISPGLASALTNRIGNMVLVKSPSNTSMSNCNFDHKKGILNESVYSLTKMVADEIAWGESEIDQRQKKLADLAVMAWPLN